MKSHLLLLMTGGFFILLIVFLRLSKAQTYVILNTSKEEVYSTT